MVPRFFLILLLVVTGIYAHPHIFMDAQADLVFDAAGFEGVQNRWTFDKLFSRAMLETADKNKDGKFDAEECRQLQELILTPALKFSDYNYIALGSAFLAPSGISNFSAIFKNEQLTLQFLNKFPINAGGDYTMILLAVNDPTNYIQITANLNNSTVNTPAALDVEYFVDSLKGLTLFSGFSSQVQGLYVRFRKKP